MTHRIEWSLWDVRSGNLIGYTDDGFVVDEWRQQYENDPEIIIVAEEVNKMAKRKSKEEKELTDAEEGPSEPADDVAEAQPSIEENTGGGTSGSIGGGAGASVGAGESGGTGTAGNPT